MTAVTTVREVMAFLEEYLLWTLGAITAVVLFAELIKQKFPRLARTLKWPARLPLRMVRWVWRQIWLQQVPGEPKTFVYRPPLVRRREAQYQRTAAVIRDVTGPEFAAVRTAAKAQHDEQTATSNARFDEVEKRLVRMESNIGAEATAWRNKVEGRLSQLEDAATQPSNPAARPRPKEKS